MVFLRSFQSAIAVAALTALFLCSLARAQLTGSALTTSVDSLALVSSFNPVIPAYWTNLPHHRRTPFALSPDGKSAYIAYLDSSNTDIHIQQVDPTSFKAVGTAITVTGGKEAGGLVAQNNGFALLTNIIQSGVANNVPIPIIVRYANGKEVWRTFVAGPGVGDSFSESAATDMNGDLVYSEASGLYGAYFVVSAYAGSAQGHFGDSIKYVDDSGKLQKIPEASNWGCSHNTGIAFEAADAPPYASICSEDHGSIWLNTKTRSMNGVKISGEHTQNGAAGEPMGGMSGSYSQFVRLPGTAAYAFAWNSRGCIDLTADSWMGNGFTQCKNRTDGRNVALATFTDKFTKIGPQASSTVGAADGDSQVNWLTTGTNDRSNVHAEAFDANNLLVTWEEITNPTCPVDAMGCQGQFSGSYFQLVNPSGNGSKVGDPIISKNVYVAGDIVRMPDNRLCWPYVNMVWDLSKPVGGGLKATTTNSMSFACLSLGTSSKPASSVASANPTTLVTSAVAAGSSTVALTSSAVSTPPTNTTSLLNTSEPVITATSEAETLSTSVSITATTTEAATVSVITPSAPASSVPVVDECGSGLPVADDEEEGDDSENDEIEV